MGGRGHQFQLGNSAVGSAPSFTFWSPALRAVGLPLSLEIPLYLSSRVTGIADIHTVGNSVQCIYVYSVCPIYVKHENEAVNS